MEERRKKEIVIVPSLKHPCDERRVGHTCRTLRGLSRALQRLLPHGAECVYEPEREYVCVSVAEGGDPTPPP